MIHINLQQPLGNDKFLDPHAGAEQVQPGKEAGWVSLMVPTGFPSRDPVAGSWTHPLWRTGPRARAGGRRGREGEEEGKRKTDQEAQQTSPGR